MEQYVNELLKKAAEQHTSQAAMQFAQAALNAAHALQVLKQVNS